MRSSNLLKVFSLVTVILALGLAACTNMENREETGETTDRNTQMDFRQARNDITQEINQLAQTVRQTSYERREEIEDNLEKRIDNLEERIEEIKDEIDDNEMSEALKQDFEAAEERLEELDSRLNDWTVISEEEWNEFQTNFARTADEFGNEMEALFTDNDYFDKEEY